MDKWEYEIRYESPLLTSNRQNKEVRMNEMGDEGWELVAWVDGSQVNVSYAVYKRRKEIEMPPEADAISFAEWISRHRLDFQSGLDGCWIGLDLERRTSAELYKLFKSRP